jgi:hypothetical protein
MRLVLCLILVTLVLSSCYRKKPKIDYSNNNQNESLTMNNLANDTSKVLIAELPVYIDSTDFMLHPLILENISNKNNKRLINIGSYSKSDFSNSNLYVESFNSDYISGNITNIVLENIKTKEKRLLTDKVINITNTTFLREIFKETHQQYLMYTVIDKDLNNDNNWDYQDIASLYISRLDGTEFTKITSLYHDYIGGKMILNELKYYYRTIEDTNKDGLFNKADKYHYYYIDFSSNPYKVDEYFPLSILKSNNK